MIRDGQGRVRLTSAEVNELRKYNAKNGEVLGVIRTEEDYLSALVSGLPPDILADMLEFMETGSSPLTRAHAAKSDDEPPTS